LDTYKGDGITCACSEGYTSTTKVTGNVCVDDDECALGTHNCSPFADCTNTEGSFKCACSDTYDGDGLNCGENFAAHYGAAVGGGVGGTIFGIIVIVVVIIVLLIVCRNRKGQKIVDADMAQRYEATLKAADAKAVAKPERIVLAVRKPEPKAKVQPEPSPAPAPEPEPEAAPAVQAAPEPEPEEPAKPKAAEVHEPSDAQIQNSAGAVLQLGSRVKVNGYQQGTVRYIGDLKDVALNGIKYVGVELDVGEGSGDGSINGHKYFHCADFHALFTTVQFVEPL